MLSFADSLDPNEIKDFTHDWTAELAAGEAIVGASVVIAFVNAAGCTQPNPISTTSNKTRVWLTGGNPGGRCIFTLTATTNATPPRTLEEAFAVNIVETTVEETEADRLRADIAQLETAQTNLATGKRIDEVWRDGRRLIYGKVTAAALDALIKEKRRQLAEAEAVAAGRPRRRAIPIGWAV